VSESVGSTLIPVLSIQPLVENAVKHGVAAKPGRGRVSVRAIQTATGLQIVIEDTGQGFEKTRKRSQNGAGLGLENVRRRLNLCYGPAGRLDIESSDTGTKVAFTVPKQSTAAEIRPEEAVEV
jgi:two-component system LytT family sensor kinase